MATLSADYPDPGSLPENPARRTSEVGWSIDTDEYLYDDQLRVITCVYTTRTTNVGITAGTVTFSTTVDGSVKESRHYWDNLSSASTYPKYIRMDAYVNYGQGLEFYLPRKSSGYTITITVTFEVKAKISSNHYRQFTDGSQTSSTTYTLTVPALPTYTISYNANGGSGAPSSQTRQYGSDVTLSYTRPTRNGYAFKSWNTKADDSGTSYAPGATYSGYDVTLYAIWNPTISYNANGGSGAPAQATKTFNEAYTIPSSVPTKTGYTFVAWNTQMYGGGTSYSPGDTIPASMNAATTLYAQWDKITPPPTISALTVVRCNSSGVANDTGAYAKITATWSVDRTYDVSNTGYITGKYKASDASGYTTFSFTSGTTAGTGGTATAIVSGMDTDKQYEFVATAHDSCDEVGHTDTTSRSVILTRARFLMDFRAGGNGLGIGSAAPQNGLEVGFETQFDEDVTVLGDLTAANLSASSDTGTDVVSATGTFSVSSSSGKKFGPVRMVCVTFSSSSSISAGTTQTLGTLASAYRPPGGMGFANAYGFGFVDSSGTVYFTPYVGMYSGSGISVTLTFINVGV